MIVLTVTLSKSYRESIALNTFQLNFDTKSAADKAEADMKYYYQYHGYSITTYIVEGVRNA